MATSTVVGYNIGARHYDRGSGDTFTPMVLAILSFWAFRFPIGFVLSRPTLLGQEGLWWSFPIGFVLTAIVTYLWYARLEMEGGGILKEEPEPGLMLQPAAAEEGVG